MILHISWCQNSYEMHLTCEGVINIFQGLFSVSYNAWCFDTYIVVKYTLLTVSVALYLDWSTGQKLWYDIRASVYSATPVSGEFVSGVVITRPQLYKWKTETLSHAAFAFSFLLPSALRRGKGKWKSWKIVEQKWLNRLQMVQFECPRHPNPIVHFWSWKNSLFSV